MLQEDVGILVIEDVQAMQVQIRELLTQIGFSRIVVVDNGIEARHVLNNQLIQLILCDWHMTPVTGLELLSYVRSTMSLKRIPFIMVTAENTRSLVLEAVRFGVDDYLLKPLTSDQVGNKVYALLIKHQVL